MRRCPSPQRLSAYVDGALPARDRERAVAHLLECPGCRDQARELRGVRERVRAGLPAGEPPGALQDRLVGIAGAESAAPLYARPFDRAHTRHALPRRRRALRRMVAASGSGVLAVVLGSLALGWLAAPPPHVRAVDPHGLAVSEFATALAAEPLANPAVAAALVARPESTTEHAVAPQAPGPRVTEGAYARLERARAAADTLAYAGTQRVQVRHRAGFWNATVGVAARPGHGVEVTLPVEGGTRTAFVPDEDGLDLTVLAAHHSLTTADGPAVAGRPTHLVEAAGSEVTARWWLDRETGLVLWTEVTERGRTVRSAGFETLDLTADAAGHLPPHLTMPVPAEALTIGVTPQLVQAGFACAPRLAGLDLVGVRRAGGALHTVYGDGVDTLSVLETRGALTRAPRDSVWDPTVRAYRSQGLPTALSWQSGDRVFTVVTNGSPEAAERAVAQLPHESPVTRTGVDRVGDGWRAVLSRMGVR